MGIAEEAIAAEVNGDEVEKTEYERRKDDRIRELAKKLKSVKLAAQSL
jgi:sulfur carrier protein ThiS